jgi:hypothetical protein
MEGHNSMVSIISINKSVFLADKIEHIYFTLPADYPLEQATPPISPSEHVSVTHQPSIAAGLATAHCSKANKATMQWVMTHSLLTYCERKQLRKILPMCARAKSFDWP